MLVIFQGVNFKATLSFGSAALATGLKQNLIKTDVSKFSFKYTTNCLVLRYKRWKFKIRSK